MDALVPAVLWRNCAHRIGVCGYGYGYGYGLEISYPRQACLSPLRKNSRRIFDDLRIESGEGGGGGNCVDHVALLPSWTFNGQLLSPVLTAYTYVLAIRWPFYFCHPQSDGGIVFSGVCLYVCLSVCLSVNTITPEPLKISSRKDNNQGIILLSRGRLRGWWFFYE